MQIDSEEIITSNGKDADDDFVGDRGGCGGSHELSSWEILANVIPTILGLIVGFA